MTAVYGGANIQTQIRALNSGSQIVVGTPGRVIDLINRKKLKLNDVEFVVLDEADEMLSSGFKEQIYSIFQYLSNEIQISLFSATMPTTLYSLTDKFMRDPIKIIVKTEQLTLEGIKQYYVNFFPVSLLIKEDAIITHQKKKKKCL